MVDALHSLQAMTTQSERTEPTNSVFDCKAVVCDISTNKAFGRILFAMNCMNAIKQ